LYLHEVWSLERDASARTKPPEETERLGCPNCGAPFESSDGRRCNYCGQVVADGRFAWQVVSREVLERESEPPALTSDVEERGTDFPSVVDRDDEAAWQTLRARDPAVDDASLQARIACIYDVLNRGWTALDLSPVRGFVSDAMFDYLHYWTEAYAAQGLRNRLERMAIARIERVKVVLDHHFSAVTLRVWASGLDYTVAADSGAVVSGSNSRPRAYSEYWTLIRAAAARGPARTDASCPSCGAPLQINMAGNCEHCSSHITRGEFDWVLSKIEQDDVYAG
ncbi:MAG TPA: TIM44-like domain-containing protein, partial [Polyangiales bacterium]|nr:TIM44-like domain-containing protein [Polyangiales bacterium]